jgi:predicted DNA-binding protein YlxM (UPF0122 family)
MRQHKRKRTSKEKNEIIKTYTTGNNKLTELAQLTKKNRSAIHNIIKRKYL